MGATCSAQEAANNNKKSQSGYVRSARKPNEEKVRRSAGATLSQPYKTDWSLAKDEHWVYPDKMFTSYTFLLQPQFEEYAGSIKEGKKKLMAEPTKYQGLKYQTNMGDWPEEAQKYQLLLRHGSGFEPKTVKANGQFTFVEAIYQRLPPQVNMDNKDKYTDSMTYQGKQLGPPRHPGRGHGCVDVPHLKVIGDIHPNDISQGTVGDCWLLSAISAMSEFDGAIKALFRKTDAIHEMPKEHLNRYVVTLYNLSTSQNAWQTVDIEIDERLCSTSDGSRLLGCQPSEDAELWACYLEKAIAIHCGGWDELDGGHCTHAWRILTGCKEQYTFINDGRGFECLGTKNPNTDKWEPLENSPLKGFQGLWPMNWPEVGGGGDLQVKCLENEMFERMCAWDDQNYIMAAGTKTKVGSDSSATDGIGHAYTVITCLNDAAGTKFDLIKVRNPWGKGEFASGMWSDDGPGWKNYPEVARICKPVKANDGVFWLSKDEFFKHFKTIYLCASCMDSFVRNSKQETVVANHPWEQSYQ
mmetsp:Transcript_95964/g.248142  ORF Transcript_95964/g.248142 Transcript_95964/m.248142 type:complete len:526 (+) Transcript_95964:60-1637(+)